MLKVIMAYSEALYLSKNKAKKVTRKWGNIYGKARTYTTEEHLLARRTLFWLIKQQMILTGWIAMKEKTFVEIHLFKPTQRGDSGNFVDSVLDVIQEVLGINDSWFIPSAPWDIDKKSPRLEVTIWQEEKGNVFFEQGNREN